MKTCTKLRKGESVSDLRPRKVVNGVQLGTPSRHHFRVYDQVGWPNGGFPDPIRPGRVTKFFPLYFRSGSLLWVFKLCNPRDRFRKGWVPHRPPTFNKKRSEWRYNSVSLPETTYRHTINFGDGNNAIQGSREVLSFYFR